MENEVTFVFNDFAQLKTEYQSHSVAVNTSTTPKVQYGYASGSANTIRPTSMTYPDGRVLTYDYGSSGGNNDAASRVASLVDDDGSSTHLADYSYLGLGTFVEVDYTEPDVKYTLVGTAGGNDPDTGDIYRGLDRFGRIKDSYWYNYGTSSDADRIKYGYDRSGNRLWRENTVATSLSKYFDELYGYDRVDRLQDMERGRLAALKDSISSLQFAQDWSLDATGNWRQFREDDDGTGWDLAQIRTANKVNEITDISETTGPSWVTPAYSRAGNMTTIPKPADPTTSYSATYDAWSRLVVVSSGGTAVAGYEYDGAKRRIIKKSYTSGTLTETRHAYFTEPSKWQVIEERVDSSSSAERQFVWGLRYIDDVVLRDRDTDGNPTLDERLYGLQDANWNVTALVSTSGAVQERYAYSAYGKPMFLDASFAPRGSSSFAWDRLFAGYVWDADVEWYAVRHRVYVVGLGWVQRDPLGYADGPNLYSYAENRPTGFADPNGTTLFGGAIVACFTNLFCVVVGGVIVAVLAFAVLVSIGIDVGVEECLRLRRRRRPIRRPGPRRRPIDPPPPPEDDDREGEPRYPACCVWHAARTGWINPGPGGLDQPPTFPFGERLVLRRDVSCRVGESLVTCCNRHAASNPAPPFPNIWYGDLSASHPGPCTAE